MLIRKKLEEKQFGFHFFWIHVHILPQNKTQQKLNLNYLVSPTSHTSLVNIDYLHSGRCCLLGFIFSQLSTQSMVKDDPRVTSCGDIDFVCLFFCCFTRNGSNLKGFPKATSATLSDKFSLVKYGFLYHIKKPNNINCTQHVSSERPFCQLGGTAYSSIVETLGKGKGGG